MSDKHPFVAAFEKAQAEGSIQQESSLPRNPESTVFLDAFKRESEAHKGNPFLKAFAGQSS